MFSGHILPHLLRKLQIGNRINTRTKNLLRSFVIYVAVTNFLERSGRVDYGKMRTIIDDIIENEPVTKRQIAELTAKSTRYLIPYKQKWSKMHGLILFNKSNRQGADEEAEDMAEGLNSVGWRPRSGRISGQEIWVGQHTWPHKIDGWECKYRKSRWLLIIPLLCHDSWL